MSQKILGVDLGTNSIGLSLRDVDNGGQLKDQLVYFSSFIFRSGVGKDNQGNEMSYASERTHYRMARRRLQSRHRRLWATLQLLIDNDCCPLSKENLKEWKGYKKNGGGHKYPIDDVPFNNWIKLDFDADGRPDYTSPYQLRKALVEEQFDFRRQENRYKLGRALYHIAQRRGFKSNKGESLNGVEPEDDSMDIISLMKESELKKSSKLSTYMKDHNLATPGQAFACLENEGVRLRGSEYQAVRSQLKDEITYIFTFQNDLSIDSDFYHHLTSEKKEEGTIFYKRPLRSQKRLVGKCTLEPNKSRCSLSHPEYELFKAWSFINNIKIRKTNEGCLEHLDLSLRQELFNKLCISKVRDYFLFKEIRLEIQKRFGGITFAYNQDKSLQTINYADNYSVDGCPVTHRLINLLGEDWQHATLKSDKTRKGHHTSMHQVHYSATDLWNICFMADDEQKITTFAKERLGWSEEDKQTKKLISLYSAVIKHSQYGMLSLKAIKNINAMLVRGFKYSDAVMLAKIPDIVSVSDKQIEKLAQYFDSCLLPKAKYQRMVARLTNRLIADYKSLNVEYRFADKNTDYQLQDSDFDDIVRVIREEIGPSEYEALGEEKCNHIKNDVAHLYQIFFHSLNRDFVKVPTLKDMWTKYLHEQYARVPEREWSKLYHPSLINYFHQTQETKLGTPNLGAIKNPVALRTLNILRSKINSLIEDGIISPDDTRIVVETAREMNDANMRWAIRTWNKQREDENKEIEKLLSEFHIEADDINKDKLRYSFEQSDLDKYDNKGKVYKINIAKYRLWKEQECRCMYTGKVISLSKLFDGHSFNIEHTLPLSQSLDNSDCNLTICDAHYNQHIKGTLLPTALPNYEHSQVIDGVEYSAIKPRLEKWEERLKHLEDRVSYWRWRAKHAQTKDIKDRCIRQMHLWNFDAEYWRKKVETFKVSELKEGFRHSQLVDTRVITRYAALYLKSLFPNVDVQKGEVTSVFRKILGIQEVYQAKDRSNNAHHAIDATMLTLMPVPAKRERMLQLFYQRQEKRRAGQDTRYEDDGLNEEIRGLHIGKSAHDIAKYIMDNILVEHPKHRDALEPSTHIAFNKKDGKKKREVVTVRNVIRGQLHEQTNLGVITQWKKDKEGAVMKDSQGSPVIDLKNKLLVYRMPLRYKVNSKEKGFKSWDDLYNSIVNKELLPMMKRQFKEGTSFKDACQRGIYMLNKKGEKVNRIRTVRIYNKSNISLESAPIIKKQTYISAKEYKNYFRAKVGQLYAGCEYSNGKVTEFRVYSLMDIANHRRKHEADIPNSIRGKQGCVLELQPQRTLKVGDTVLLYQRSIDELRHLDNKELGRRLYVINAFESDGRIRFVKSSIADKSDKGKAVKEFKDLPDVIRTAYSKVKYIIEGSEFTLKNGMITINV